MRLGFQNLLQRVIAPTTAKHGADDRFALRLHVLACFVAILGGWLSQSGSVLNASSATAPLSVNASTALPALPTLPAMDEPAGLHWQSNHSAASSRVQPSSCGDYVHVGRPRQQAVGGRSEPTPELPCQGPNCFGAPYRPDAPPPPIPPLTGRDVAVVHVGAIVLVSGSLRYFPSEPIVSPTDAGGGIFRPPRSC